MKITSSTSVNTLLLAISGSSYSFSSAFAFGGHRSPANFMSSSQVSIHRLNLADKPYFLSESTFAAVSDSDNDSSGSDSISNDIYARVGFDKSQIGIGVDPSEVLQWLGTRDDLIAKFKKDNKGFDDERAAIEVDKFMMDVEMVDKYIAFEQKKAENLARGAEYFKESRKENLSDPSTWATYALWIGGGVGFAYFKNVIAAPKYESGEWQDIHIPLPTPFWINEENVAEGVASSTVGLVENAEVTSETVISASVSATAETVDISQAVDTVQAVVDAASM